jgi:hypothetical protein
MIRYTLTCADGHRFESWFQSGHAFDALAAKGLVSCAICGGVDVTKALMTPRVASQDAPDPVQSAAQSAVPTSAPAGVADDRPPLRPLSAPSTPAETMLRAMRAHLAQNSTYVGGAFVAEARAMHLGETQERMIHGEAKPEEARALIDEGIPIVPLPFVPPDKTN